MIPTDWRAKNVAELRQIWADLRWEKLEFGIERTFRGQELTPEQASDVFECRVLEAFRHSGATGHYGFEVPLSATGHTCEQIDGLIFDGWQGFLVECKFWKDKVDFGPVGHFHAQLDRRPPGRRPLTHLPPRTSPIGPPAIESPQLPLRGHEDRR